MVDRVVTRGFGTVAYIRAMNDFTIPLALRRGLIKAIVRKIEPCKRGKSGAEDRKNIEVAGESGVTVWGCWR